MADRAETPAAIIRQPGAGSLLLGWLCSAGVLSATPVLVFFLIGFVGPLVIVLAFSFTPERTFDLGAGFTTENYERIFTEMDDLPLREHIWPKFLRENAAAVFKLDDLLGQEAAPQNATK